MPLNQHHRVSFEFFPPKTDIGREKLLATRNELQTLNPSFFSVTYGAGGSTRDNTKAVVVEGLSDGFDIAPHLSFGGDNEDVVLAMLEEYKAAGVRRIIALRGDMPSGFGKARLVYSNQLVSFIREHFGNHFELEVAAYPEIHPEAESYDKDIYYLQQKFSAGASSAITQYFYCAEAFEYFMEECTSAGISQPIYPGIMPITNFDNLQRFSRNCGAEIPRWIERRVSALQSSQDDLQHFCTDLITRLCEKLLAAGAPGFHFYTLNQARPTADICRNLGLGASSNAIDDKEKN